MPTFPLDVTFPHKAHMSTPIDEILHRICSITQTERVTHESLPCFSSNLALASRAAILAKRFATTYLIWALLKH